MTIPQSVLANERMMMDVSSLDASSLHSLPEEVFASDSKLMMDVSSLDVSGLMEGGRREGAPGRWSLRASKAPSCPSRRRSREQETGPSIPRRKSSLSVESIKEEEPIQDINITTESHLRRTLTTVTEGSKEDSTPPIMPLRRISSMSDDYLGDSVASFGEDSIPPMPVRRISKALNVNSMPPMQPVRCLSESLSDCPRQEDATLPLPLQRISSDEHSAASSKEDSGMPPMQPVRRVSEAITKDATPPIPLRRISSDHTNVSSRTSKGEDAFPPIPLRRYNSEPTAACKKEDALPPMPLRLLGSDSGHSSVGYYKHTTTVVMANRAA